MKIDELLIEFDEMGFAPTTLCENPDEYACEWKKQLVAEIERLKAENEKRLNAIEDFTTKTCCLKCEIAKLLVKEFAEKLKNALKRFVWKHNIPECIFYDVTDELLKEYEK